MPTKTFYIVDTDKHGVRVGPPRSHPREAVLDASAKRYTLRFRNRTQANVKVNCKDLGIKDVELPVSARDQSVDIDVEGKEGSFGCCLDSYVLTKDAKVATVSGGSPDAAADDGDPVIIIIP